VDLTEVGGIAGVMSCCLLVSQSCQENYEGAVADQLACVLYPSCVAVTGIIPADMELRCRPTRPGC